MAGLEKISLWKGLTGTVLRRGTDFVVEMYFWKQSGSVATMQAVFCWNEYINAYTFTRSTDMKTITLGLNDFVGSMGLTDWGGTFAAITVTVLPVFIFYFFSSKKMLAGMTAGAVKG